MKKIILILAILITVFFIYKFFFKGEQAVEVVYTIKDIIAEEVHQDDMLKKAGQVARLKKFFHDDFQGSIEHLNIKGRAAVSEHLTLLVRIYCPLISEVEEITIREKGKNSCLLLINANVKKSRPVPGLKEKYFIEAGFLKDQGKWKIISLKEIESNK